MDECAGLSAQCSEYRPGRYVDSYCPGFLRPQGPTPSPWPGMRTCSAFRSCRRGRRPGWPLLPPPGEVPRRGDRGAFRFASPFRLCRTGALRFASPLWSPARAASPPCLKGGGPQGLGNIDSVDPRGTVLGLADPFGEYEERQIFFLFARPKRKNQRETTLGRGRLRFLPLPRPTLMEMPKRGDPLLEHPRAVRIRPGLLYLFGLPAGHPPLASPSGGGVAKQRKGRSPPGGDEPRPYSEKVRSRSISNCPGDDLCTKNG